MPANDNKISPLAWVALFFALICDGLKFLLFFMNAIPAIGTVLDAAGSFIVSIIEICAVFGLLWFAGIYKGKGSVPNMLVSIGVSAVDLVPIVDDIPFTTPTVLFLIMQGKVSSMIGGMLGAAPPAAANDDASQKTA